jgi:hypothetical protein
MAHFAKIDSNNRVVYVTKVNNSILLDSEGIEQEQLGLDFLNNNIESATWIQTSYNNNLRKQYAGIGYLYDPLNDVFISPQPFNSWVLDSNFDWQSPVARPEDDNLYEWNETNQSWDLLVE